MIRTARLTLRAAQEADLEPLHAIFSDPVAMRYWDRPAYTDLAETTRFLDHFMHGDWNEREEYILDLDGTCIGKAGCWKRAEIGYILAPEHWGKGYVTEALRVIIPRCFEKFPQETALTAEIDPRNHASEKVLLRLGFSHLRTEEKNFLYGADEWCDTAYYHLPRGRREDSTQGLEERRRT